MILTEDECYEFWYAGKGLIDVIRTVYKTGYTDAQIDAARGNDGTETNEQEPQTEEA